MTEACRGAQCGGVDRIADVLLTLKDARVGCYGLDLMFSPYAESVADRSALSRLGKRSTKSKHARMSIVSCVSDMFGKGIGCHQEIQKQN